MRSSATAEDLPGASFAGQQETFLHVHGCAVVAEAVRACWASLWTARAMAYRAQRGVDPATVHRAVVVQGMVEADAAGVLFTANPVTGRRDQLVISAAWGLGEAVVGGSVTTDDLVVDRATGRVLSRTTADKPVMTLYAEHGTAQRPVPQERRRAPVLDDAAAPANADAARHKDLRPPGKGAEARVPGAAGRAASRTYPGGAARGGRQQPTPHGGRHGRPG